MKSEHPDLPYELTHSALTISDYAFNYYGDRLISSASDFSISVFNAHKCKNHLLSNPDSPVIQDDSSDKNKIATTHSEALYDNILADVQETVKIQNRQSKSNSINTQIALEHSAYPDYVPPKSACNSTEGCLKKYKVKWILDCRLHQAHEGYISALDWAHPTFGQIFASCSEDQKVCIWTEKKTDCCKFTKNETETTGINGIEFFKDYNDAAASLWLNSWFCTAQLETNAPVFCVKFAPKEHGLYLAACDQRGVTHIFQTDDCFRLCKWKHNSIQTHPNCTCTAVEWSKHSLKMPLLCVGGTNGIIVLVGYTYNSWLILESIQAHLNSVLHLEWSSSTFVKNGVLASCGDDKFIRFWHLSQHGTRMINYTEGDLGVIRTNEDKQYLESPGQQSCLSGNIIKQTVQSSPEINSQKRSSEFVSTNESKARISYQNSLNDFDLRLPYARKLNCYKVEQPPDPQNTDEYKILIPYESELCCSNPPIWRLSWNALGNIISAVSDDGKIHIWRMFEGAAVKL